MHMWNNDFQLNIIRGIQRIHNPFFDFFFQGVTMLAESYVAIAIFLIIYWCINKEFGYRLGFIIISSNAINVSIKEAFKIPRLFWNGQNHIGIRSLRIYTATGYSFPSGHTQGISAFLTCCSLKIKKLKIYIAAVFMILLVATSRLYLGVHRPIDVVFGAVFGITWAVAFNFIINLIEKNDRRYILLFIIPIIIGLIIFKTDDYYRMAGAFTALIAGYILEPKFINYRIKAGVKNSLLKLIVGIIGIAIVYVLLKLISLKGLLFCFIEMLMLILWITLGATFIFKKLNI